MGGLDASASGGSSATGGSNTGGSGSGGKVGAGGTTGSGGKAGTGGTTGSGGKAGTGGATGSGGAISTGGTSGCHAAHQLWFDDFETGDYRRWTGNTYGNDFGDSCQNTAVSTEQAVSPTHSERSDVVCTYSDSQRGYGILQFSGDSVLANFTNAGTGIDAPNGIVTIQHLYLVSPTVFENGKWLSLWGMDGACDWSDAVLSIGFEDSSNRLAAAHYQDEGTGTRTFLPNAPSFPRGQWVRLTVFLSFYDGHMYIWQDGKPVSDVTFQRPLKTMCQFHWGIYASHDNDDIVLFEDDYSVWKLDKPWTDFSVEPWFPAGGAACN
jgi:hypothetical protein